MVTRCTEAGFTIVELLISLAIAALLLTAMTGLVNNALEIQDDTGTRNDTTRDGRFAMQRMLTAVLGTERLMLPLADNPNTDWREHVREQTVPATPPEGSSTLATAVLAVTLDPTLDLDADGFADADNDKDGRVDEDLPNDNTLDGANGIIGIDDDGDGTADESSVDSLTKDNDEDGVNTEDRIDGKDADGDGSIDEDIQQEMNGDNQPGIAGVDDDGDGSVDEGQNQDDDEDGTNNEDWFDPVVFFLSGPDLIERRPNLNPVDGTDYTEYVIAENVSRFRVERIPDTGKRAVLVDITLEVTPPAGEAVSLSTRIRVGGGR
jgi:prepilin-type N-terminal cleavage/methylation domain-containing protein